MKIWPSTQIASPVPGNNVGMFSVTDCQETDLFKVTNPDRTTEEKAVQGPSQT
jgi:hypothetical protein